MYVFNKTMQFNETEVPADLRQDKLSNYEMGKLMDLKRWIYKIRAEHRKSEDRSRRQEEKEQAKQEKEALQPKMFEF